jgi:hypothetical protein
MKRTELIKKITGLGAVLERHGAKHDWYVKRKPMWVRQFLVSCIIKATRCYICDFIIIKHKCREIC